jgi:hypothetical protein
MKNHSGRSMFKPTADTAPHFKISEDQFDCKRKCNVKKMRD